MIKVLILVCAIALQPKDCNRDTATMVLNGPSMPANSLPYACMRTAQEYFAGSAFGREIDLTKEYVRTLCTRTVIGKDNVA